MGAHVAHGPNSPLSFPIQKTWQKYGARKKKQQRIDTYDLR